MFPPKMPFTLRAHDQRRVSVAAPVDPRTLVRYLRGRPIRHLSALRIERALAELGLATKKKRAVE